MNISTLVKYFIDYKSFLVFLILPPFLLILTSFICKPWKLEENTYISLSPYPNKTEKTFEGMPKSRHMVWSFYLTLFIFILFYIYLMFYGSEFANLDDTQLTRYSLRGEPFAFPIWKDSGRFWPLGLQEYNILSLIGNTPTLFNAFSVFQLLTILVFCHDLISRIHPLKRAPLWQVLVILTIIIIPSIAESFFRFIIPERNIIFWLLILIVSFHHYLSKRSFFSLVGIILSAQLLLYYKEPIFILFSVFSFMRIAFKLTNFQQDSESKKLKNIIAFCWIEVCLLILSMTFFLFYIKNVYPYIKSRYGEDDPLIQATLIFLRYTKTDPLFFFTLLCCSVKLAFTFFKKAKFDLFWDALLIASASYFFVFIKLKMFRVYYSAPIDFISILYLLDLANEINFSSLSNSLNKKNHRRILAFILSLGFGLISLVNINLSSDIILRNKFFVNANVKLTSFLEQYSTSQGSKSLNLFFVSAKDEFQIMEFLGFLDYKGFNVQPDRKDSSHLHSGGTRIIAKGKYKFPNNLCVPYRSFQCFPSEGSQKGDLQITLPLKPPLLSNSESTLTKQPNGNVLFSYPPQFSIPERILLVLSNHQTEYYEWATVYVTQDPE